MDIGTFLSGEWDTHSDSDRARYAVLDLIRAGTRALNAYADNAGKPSLTFVVQNTGTGMHGYGVTQAYEQAVGQAGRD